MSEIAPKSSDLQSRAIEGILCLEIGMLFFVMQDGMMKFMLGTYPVWMLIFARAVVAIAILTPVILWLGAPHRLFTPLWPWHLARATLFTGGFSLFYTAFPFMGLAEVTTIFFAAPLITAALAAVCLGETIGPHRIGALLVGFAGVIIAMNPTSAGFQWIAVLPLICALTYAMSQIIVRRIGDQETTITTGLYTIAFSGFLILPIGWTVNQLVEIGPEFRHLRWEWPALTPAGVVHLGLLGAIGMFGFMMLSRAYQITSASLVAPFDYTYLPLATLMAYFVWNEIPHWTTMLGMSIIVLSGLYLGYREVQNTRRRAGPAPTAEAVFAPGNPIAPMTLGADIED